ncbi:MAG: hypothetical protein ACKVHP_19295, partial [Verrucomicrobiales bacterium]
MTSLSAGRSINLDGSFLAFLVTIGWLVVIPNIINLIDGIDGLAGGLGLFVGITLAIVTLSSGNFLAGSIALFLEGSFLVFNVPPAKVYTGRRRSLLPRKRHRGHLIAKFAKGLRGCPLSGGDDRPWTSHSRHHLRYSKKRIPRTSSRAPPESSCGLVLDEIPAVFVAKAPTIPRWLSVYRLASGNFLCAPFP